MPRLKPSLFNKIDRLMDGYLEGSVSMPRLKPSLFNLILRASISNFSRVSMPRLKPSLFNTCQAQLVEGILFAAFQCLV